jgi:hypothetical protein
MPVFDRVVVAYLTLPLLLFIAGWLQPWVAIPLLACVGLSLVPLIAALPAAKGPIESLKREQILIAVGVATVWTVFGGTGHFLFANADWHVRDAVLHDLVVSPWPVGYGSLGAKESLLRAPVAYFLPAALIGKFTSLSVAHFAMAAWTAFGASLFLMQVFSLLPRRIGVMFAAAAIIVLFSGLDIVGLLVNYGPRFRENWNIALHLEWWANNYQYSSMTTQLFWVPNHALGGWLTIGLLSRGRVGTKFDAILPIVVVAAALWSPLTAVGMVPFVLLKAFSDMRAEHSWKLLNPGAWGPAAIVGVVIAGYLTLDPGSIPKGWSVDAGRTGFLAETSMKLQFFLIEAGLIGIALLSLRRSREVLLALAILAILPFAYFGPGNDLVMRASIPSLVVLAITCCLVLLGGGQESTKTLGKRLVLTTLLLVGAVTAVQEFARAILLPAWPINLQATLIEANCGSYPPHYVARLDQGPVSRLLRPPHALPVGPLNRSACINPALAVMVESHLF